MPSPRQPLGPGRPTLTLGHSLLVVSFVRHRRARHYVLRVQNDGSLRVTVPRGGSRLEAERFVREKADWVKRELYRLNRRQAARQDRGRDHLMIEGQDLPVEMAESDAGRIVRCGGLDVPLGSARTPLAALERQLRNIAGERLPRRLLELAAAHGCWVAGTTVRAQRTRWGSCSPAGRISLNWRLIQLPPSVSDYVMLHELAHLHHLNHSKRFWRELERICPWHREARAWLKAHAEQVLA